MASVPAFKRSRVDDAADTSTAGATCILETFLAHFKKDTLQNMCEDLSLPCSGTKAELMMRIVRNM